jgi:hypothetical protein
MHILTRHLSLFALTGDTEAPTPPTNVSASVNDGNLTLYWRTTAARSPTTSSSSTASR